jgi:primosomal protein N' (replication factor Y)
MVKYKIAKVILPIALDKEFDYTIGSKTAAKKGMRVLVDFRGKKTIGIVTTYGVDSKIKNLKPIIDTLDTYPALTSEHMRFARLLAKFYPYDKSEFLFMMLPAYLKKPRKIDLPAPQKFSVSSASSFEQKLIKATTFSQRYSLWQLELKQSLEKGSALICFPQLSYLLEAKKIIDKDFGPKVKVIHSYESEKEFFNNWQHSRRNCLILGTRTAIFQYPLDLNLIIVEEENSPFYFQEEKPFYHLLDVAFLLSRMKKIKLILSADFPTLYTYKLVKDRKITLQELPEEKRDIKIISLTGRSRSGAVNPVLAELLRKNIAEGKKSIIFLNKKGFGSRASCLMCGYTFICERCLVPLRILVEENINLCPYCSKKTTLAKVCPKCNSNYIKISGYGIERLESVLKKFFPEANIAKWQNRTPQTQIVLSTSEILTSLYSPQAFDAGFVLDVDSWMSLSDYEAIFDAFIYLKKISLFLKNIFVFTYNASHHIFEDLQKDWKLFYDTELIQRKELSLPPFYTLSKITLRAKDQNSLFRKADALYNKLGLKFKEVYGPLKEHPFKMRGKFYYSVIVKSRNTYLLRSIIKEEVKNLRSCHIQVAAKIQ